MTKFVSPNALDYINDLLSRNQGVGLGDSHDRDEDKRWLAKNLPSINANILFLEQDAQQTVDGRAVNVQPFVDQFLKHPENKEARAQLRKYVVNYHHPDEGESYMALIESAAKCGKQVVFINQRGELDEIKKRNDFMESIIREHSGDDKSYILLVGAGHLGEHGVGESKRSLSKRLGIPALNFVDYFYPSTANNPQFPLEPSNVFQFAGSNYDATISLVSYQPAEKIEMQAPEKPVEEEGSQEVYKQGERVSFVQAHANQYNSAAARIAALAKMAATMGSPDSSERLNAISERVRTAVNIDPIVSKRSR